VVPGGSRRVRVLPEGVGVRVAKCNPTLPSEETSNRSSTLSIVELHGLLLPQRRHSFTASSAP
jgi:hypothetical protein